MVIQEKLQEDLINVHDWLCANKLTLHIGKTNCMLIGTSRKINKSPGLDLILQEQQIQEVGYITYLGVNIDRYLKFDKHVDMMVGKINRALGVLKRACKYIPLKSRKIIFNTLVLPHFDYCITVWGSCNSSLITRLQRLQNRAMRIVLQCHFRTHICEMLAKLNWMNVRQRIFYQKCILMWKVHQGIAPDYINSQFMTNTTYLTQSVVSGNYVIPRLHDKSFAVSGATTWNSLPPDIRSLNKVTSFKRVLVKYIFAKL